MFFRQLDFFTCMLKVDIAHLFGLMQLLSILTLKGQKSQ